MSWGAQEFASESAYNSVFTTPTGHNGVTFVASSGDSGTTEYPSVSPNVLAVGGTTLNVTSHGSLHFRDRLELNRRRLQCLRIGAVLANCIDGSRWSDSRLSHDARRRVGRQPGHRRIGL